MEDTETAAEWWPTTPLQAKWKAEDVLTDLKAALGSHGIVLPSVQIERVGYCNVGDPHQLIELGRVNLRTAVKLVAVLTPGVETQD